MLDATFRSRRSAVTAVNGMVATSQPLAAQAGLRVLQDGGNAADAAVATAAMLNVVEPNSCGMGGDCFALFYEVGSGQITALNGSGRAPAGASIEELRGLGYERMPTFTAHTVTVPGAVAGWCDLLDRHGTRDLATVLAPAIETAREGFGVTEWISHHWQRQVERLLRDPAWTNGDLDIGPPQPSGYELLHEGHAPRPGDRMKMPELARSLAAVAEGGADAFYRGDLGRALSEHVRAYGGWITPEDLAAHESTWDEPISVEYRGVRLWECPPNGQGIIAAIAARLADGFDLGGMDEADRTHLAVECMRRGRADALRYVGDPRCVEVPTETLLSDAYTERRRAEINPKRASRHAGPGRIGTDTVYVSVVDGAGNACSCIGSLFMGFGTSLVVPGTGISLQNRGAGFSLDETHPNALAPGRRPFHTIIPALTTTPDGALESCYGVMGGPMQPQGHLQVLINRFDRGLEPQAALDRPRWRLDDEGHLFVEVGTDERVVAELERRGHEVTVVEGPERSQFGSGQIIRRDPENGVLTGASDPRADGAAVGY